MRSEQPPSFGRFRTRWHSPRAVAPPLCYHRSAWTPRIASATRGRSCSPESANADRKRCLRAHAVIAGCGALGSFHAAALARAGVGRLTLIDRDYVEPSNLHRQWLFEEADAAEAPAQGRRRRAAYRAHQFLHPRARRHRRSHRLQRGRTARRCRRHPGRHGQLRDPLPDQRFRREPRHSRGSTARPWPATASPCR